MRALYNQFNKDTSMHESSYNILNNMRSTQRGYSPSHNNSSMRSQQQIRGRSVDPSFESSRQNIMRQNSPPRSVVKNELSNNTTAMSNYITNQTAINNSNLNIQPQQQLQSSYNPQNYQNFQNIQNTQSL